MENVDSTPDIDPDERELLNQTPFKFFVTTPVNLRPHLEDYGIEELDSGICEDTASNRKRLRGFKMSWSPVYDFEGNRTGAIEAHSEEYVEQNFQSAVAVRSPILVDPRDVDSDYQSGYDLILNYRAEEIVPGWVLSQTKWYESIEDKRAKNPERQFSPTYTSPPGRCVAVKSDGHRCLLWNTGRTTDRKLCKMHLGRVGMDSTASVKAARENVKQLAHSATEILALLADTATSEAVKLKAATEILDRAGVRGGIEIEHTGEIEIRPAVSILTEKLALLSKGKERVEELLAQPVTENGEDSDIIEATIVTEKDGET